MEIQYFDLPADIRVSIAKTDPELYYKLSLIDRDVKDYMNQNDKPKRKKNVRELMKSKFIEYVINEENGMKEEYYKRYLTIKDIFYIF